MRWLLTLLIVFSQLYPMSFAQEPLVKYDVTVLQNATQNQCYAARNGGSGPTDEVVYSRGGEYTGTGGPGVRSCTGCAVDYQTRNCVCRVCYYYFN